MSIRVLHVDDEPDFARSAGAFVERADPGLAVTPVTDATAALERVREERFECVVSDYDMPGMNGLELLSRVSEVDPGVPFVLFTGKGSEEIAAEAISKGVTDYLRKQGGTDQYMVLARRIRNAVEQRRAEARADRTRRFLEKVLEHATDVIAVVNSDHEIVFVSGSIEEILGYDPAAITERAPFEFVHPADREALRRRFEERLQDDDRPTGIRFRALTRDGREIACTARAYNLVDDPDVEGVLVYMRPGEHADTETDEDEDEDEDENVGSGGTASDDDGATGDR